MAGVGTCGGATETGEGHIPKAGAAFALSVSQAEGASAMQVNNAVTRPANNLVPSLAPTRTANTDNQKTPVEQSVAIPLVVSSARSDT